MVTVLTSSAATIESHIGAYKPLFSPIAEEETNFFDEGPRVSRIRAQTTFSLSGSMDTSAIDAYAQGVELTRQSRYDAGIFKIWSGEHGHKLKRNRYGMDKALFTSAHYADLDLFNPVRYVEAQAAASPLWSRIITFPIVISDNDQYENNNFDGVIEPLTIRRVASFTSIDVPYEAHAVRGVAGNGNTDRYNTTDQVLTIHTFREAEIEPGFLDLVDVMGDTPMNGFFPQEVVRLAPFTDRRLVRNVIDTVTPTDMLARMSLMTGSTDNYLRFDQRSAVCGRDYDNTTAAGTDSLAFGGMIF